MLSGTLSVIQMVYPLKGTRNGIFISTMRLPRKGNVKSMNIEQGVVLGWNVNLEVASTPKGLAQYWIL